MPSSNPDQYKDSILLPKTDFPMKGNLPQTEPQRINDWDSNNVYKKMIDKNNGKPLFVMPDGPPYANGNLHVGHVLNKVLKDVVVKYKNMAGFQTVFVPGWDCHGLPIELNVTKKLGDKKNQLTDSKIRELCRQEALKWVDIQRKQFVRLGILAEWENPYLTLNPKYEADEVRVLAKILDNGVLYRGEKPVYWCPALQTALAAAEVEYRDHTSPSVYVKFPIDLDFKSLGIQLNQKPTSIVIWTTTPWTLPANYGICLNENFQYGVFNLNDKEYIILAKDLAESFAKETEHNIQLVGEFKGSILEGKNARHPFIDRNSLVMLGDHITLEAGTGCVHTAPGHGLDDYHVGMKYNLPIESPVDKSGKFTDQVPQYKGISIWDANQKIVDDLQASGHLLGFKKITHSYPHNPRSKTPLIFRATPQWFVKLDDEKYPVREKTLKQVESEIQFFPSWGSQRLESMVKNSPDWCLSRQRIWGVPIPVFYCDDCSEALVNSEIMNKVADKMETTNRGIEAFHETPTEEFTTGYSCSKCNGKKFTKGSDILDVWFDSGVCHTAVQQRVPGLTFPADIYLEGSDQHRGWFQTSLISSIAAYGKAPYKSLITHGFVMDASGYKMSKSLGNVVDPAQIIEKMGAEILRLWTAYEDYGQDVNIGQEIFQRVSETYRRFRNTFRFMLGNLSDFDLKKDQVPFDKMMELDQWALIRLNEVVKKVRDSYDRFEFYKVFHTLNNFFTVDLSAIYLDILKDRLYTWKQTGVGRRSAQTAIWSITEKTILMLSPIVSFLAEEAYSHFPGKSEDSVFMCSMPTFDPSLVKEELTTKFSSLIPIREAVQKELEALRRNKVIGSSLEAEVFIVAKQNDFQHLKSFENHLKEFFIVSKVNLQQGEELKVSAQKAPGEKCVRCWNYNEEIGSHAIHTTICPKCIEALS